MLLQRSQSAFLESTGQTASQLLSSESCYHIKKATKRSKAQKNNRNTKPGEKKNNRNTKPREKKTKKYSQNKIKKHNRHQHNTDDGGQAMGEELIHVQMSRRSKHTDEGSEQQ